VKYWLCVLSLLVSIGSQLLYSQTDKQADPNANLPAKARAWNLLDDGAANSSYEKRSKAMAALGVIKDDPEAERMAVKGRSDQRPEVRAAAAAALGDIGIKSATTELHKMFKDTDVTVIMAAARALLSLGDDSGYQVYYAILTGESKTGASLLEEQKKMLKDPQKMAQFGFEQGIAFIPFAGLGWNAVKMIRKDDTAPVMAASAITLANDPDPKSGEALATAAKTNKSWIARAAALNALAKRGNPALLPDAEQCLADEKEEVQYAAAGAVIRLRDIAELPAPARKPPAKKTRHK
jgi:HEAT repeat protein